MQTHIGYINLWAEVVYDHEPGDPYVKFEVRKIETYDPTLSENEVLTDQKHRYSPVAEPFATGHVKFDGIAEFNFREQLQIVGTSGVIEHTMLLHNIFRHAETYFGKFA